MVIFTKQSSLCKNDKSMKLSGSFNINKETNVTEQL